MRKLSLIILAYTDSQSVFEMNLECIQTFVASAKKASIEYEIILVESDALSTWEYPIEQFKIIKPNHIFNFHKFLNLGIDKASGDHFVLSNNDVVYDVNAITELLSVHKIHPKIQSFSPYDKRSNKLPNQVVSDNKYIIGYDIQKHLTGWCIIVNKNVFKKIKKLDETFDFYYADFDYAMQLRQHNICHALVSQMKVAHLESMSSKNEKNIPATNIPKNIPQYVLKENWTWVLENEKMMAGLIKFHNKWGSRKLIKLKCYLNSKLAKFGLGYLNKFIFAIK